MIPKPVPLNPAGYTVVPNAYASQDQVLMGQVLDLNEHTASDTAAFRELLKRTRTVYMVGDWINVDPVIGTFLQQYHSSGVPLYEVFPKGGGEAKVLPTVLTASLVCNSLLAAAR